MTANNRSGFTLLEVLIAMAIMMVAFASIMMVQSSSIQSSIKAKNLNIVSMLARNKLVESELEWEGKRFSELDKEKEGEFKEPFQDFKWKREIKEVKFPTLDLSGAAAGGDTEANPAEAGAADGMSRVGKIITAYLSKGVREVAVTITWKRGKGEQAFTVSTYWIDLDAEFSINE